MLTLVSTIISTSTSVYGTYLPLSPQRHAHHVYDEVGVTHLTTLSQRQGMQAEKEISRLLARKPS